MQDKTRIMETIKMAGATIHLSESMATCPHCERYIPMDEIEPKFRNQSRHYFNMKCLCNRIIGIAQNFRGDFVAYKRTSSHGFTNSQSIVFAAVLRRLEKQDFTTSGEIFRDVRMSQGGVIQILQRLVGKKLVDCHYVGRKMRYTKKV